ncbi:MAG: TonB-dependent receptor plug domain-containing protein, partial [bacterium]
MSHKSKLFIFILAVVLTFSLAFGQENATVTGTVTDENENPLVGADVFIPEMNLGSATNIDGVYEFIVPAALVQGQEVSLTARYIGYRSKTEKIVLQLGTIKSDFTLNSDVLKLEEVVITGMGVGIQKEKLGVTIGKVKAQEVVESDETNVVSALHGKVANVEITSTSGEPGAATYIRIRGANTIQGSTQPLIVVDGSPINNSSIVGGQSGGAHGGITPTNRASDINPEDIESVEILKGAAASAIYGSRAGGGVVLITTKSGKPGRVKVSYKTSYSFDKVDKYVPVQRTYGQGIDGQSMTGNIPWSWGAKLDASTPTYDHTREMFETGNVFENNLTISGGNQRTTYYLSLSRYNQDGVIKGSSDYEKTAVRLKGSQRIADKLTVTGNFAFADVSINRIQRGSNVSGLLLGALRTPPDFNNLPYLNECGV